MLYFCSRPEPTNFLIKNNASVSAVDKVNRNTPLHCAVLAGNVDAAHILLEAGASVDAENINVSFTQLELQKQSQRVGLGLSTHLTTWQLYLRTKIKSGFNITVKF